MLEFARPGRRFLRAGRGRARADRAADIQLPAGPLNASLFALASQTGVQILFTSQMVAGRRRQR